MNRPIPSGRPRPPVPGPAARAGVGLRPPARGPLARGRARGSGIVVALTCAAVPAGLPAPVAAQDPAEAPAARPAAAPGSRSTHAMVWHGTLRRVVMVGGVRRDVPGGVWAWDGATWGEAGADAPATRRGHAALAYDPLGDRLLLHGGLALGPGPDVRHGDLQSWDGHAWTRVHGADEGPGVRDHHAMVADRARGEVLLFGGGRGRPGEQVLLGDTWRFDGERWRRHGGPGPSPRAAYGFAYDEARQRAVLFGGWTDEGLAGDTWEWEGAGWQLVAEEGPSPRFAHRMAWDGARGAVVLHGGRNEDGNLADTWEWDGRGWTDVGAGGPGRRNVHAMAYDPDRGRVVMHGGLRSDGYLADTWERDGARWLRMDRPAPGAAPAPRGAAVGGRDPESGRLLLSGGIGAEPAAYGDLWSWSGAAWERRSVPGASPSSRFNAAGAFLPGRQQLVLHGGGGIDERRGDTWLLEAGAWRRIEGLGPSPRDCARMVARPRHGDAILYGGAGPGGELLRDTWRWDGRAWTRLATDGPPGACFHALAYDEARDRVVHYGGRGGGGASRDTWVLEGDGGRRVDGSAPPPRDHHAMAWDRARGEVVLFGGGGQRPDGSWDRSVLADTWAWDGRRWARRHDPGAPSRAHAPLLVGTDTGVLLFGGSDGERSRGDLWAWDGTRWHRVGREAAGG